MKDKSFDKYKRSRFGEGFTKETVRARYENLKKNENKEPITMRENLADIKIRQAMADGELDNLPGKGKPVDLTNYYDLPEHLRTAYQMLKNSGFIPEEVRLKKEMEILKEKIQQCDSDHERNRLMKQLSEVSRQFNFHMEYNKGFKKSLY